jgi:hypothetical protein
MKNRYWFIAAAAGLAIAFLMRSPWMAFVIEAFLLLVVICRFSSLAWLSGLDCARSVSQTMLQQGEDTEIEVTLKNTHGWPIPWIYIEDHLPGGFPLIGQNRRLSVLMPGRSITLRYTLTCPRRGYHRIGPLLMESGDLFGLHKRFRTGVQQDYISVLPTIAYIDTFNIASKRPQGPVRISNRIYSDPTRISNIREYVQGDPLNTIHWKATARTGVLHVKTPEPSSVTGATLVLDLHGDSYVPVRREERMELAITTAASIAYLLQMSGEQTGMITNGRDAAEVARYEVESRSSEARDEAEADMAEEEESARINPLTVPTLRSPIQAQKIAENLARIIPGQGLDAAGLILSEFRQLPRDAALLLVSPYVSERLALTLAAMKENGFNVNVFFILDQNGFEEAAQLLAPHLIQVFHIEHERNLHEISPAKIGF